MFEEHNWSDEDIEEVLAFGKEYLSHHHMSHVNPSVRGYLLYMSVCMCTRQMILTGEYSRQTWIVEDLLNYYVFWTDEKRLLFLIEVVDYIINVNPTASNIIEDFVKKHHEDLWNSSNFERIFSTESEQGWRDCLGSIEKELYNGKATSKNRKMYNGKSFCELLRAIRNMKAHLGDKSEAVKMIIGYPPVDFLNYWHYSKRFPFLLDAIWHSVRHYRDIYFNVLKDKQSDYLVEMLFEKYFRGLQGQSTLDEICRIPLFEAVSLVFARTSSLV